MRRALVALALAASLPAAAAPRQKVAVLDVRTVQGVAAGTATILTAIIAGDVARGGFDVLSQSDIAALIGFEKQKRMLGCGDDSSCLAEIGGALGAEYVLFTQVGQIGSRFHLSLQLLDARKALVVSRISTFSETTEDALAETAQRAVAETLAAAKSRSAPAVARAEAAKVPAAAPAPPSERQALSPSPVEAPAPAASAVPPAPRGAAAPRALRGYYVEARGGTGWADTGIVGARTGMYDGVALAARGGYRWTREWAFELGGGFEKLAHATGEFEIALIRYPTRSEMRAFYGTVGAVWTPRQARAFSVAAEAGLAKGRFRFSSTSPSGVASPYLPQQSFDPWLPRFAVEARLDYPTRWITLGLRAGVALMRSPAYTVPYDPMSMRPAITWTESGWALSVPVTAAVRYEF